MIGKPHLKTNRNYGWAVITIRSTRVAGGWLWRNQNFNLKGV
jgi:hypothetical protein